MKTWLNAVDAARAVAAAHDGGPAVAVVTVVDGPGAGRRLLVHPPGAETGSKPHSGPGSGPDCWPDSGPGSGPGARPGAVGPEHHAVIIGSLGSPPLDAAARELGLRALAEGGALLEEVAAESPPNAPDPNAPGKVTLYAEAHHPPEELVIVGAGHIAVPLAELGVRLGYRVVVLDDREEFATAERFPDEAKVLRTDFADPFREVSIGARSHVVLVTRAHKYDYDCLLHLLQGEASPRYIGMIGSRRRVRATFLALLEAGVPRERIALVRAPVGLEIGAETPEEIAVSVAAELIMLRRGVLDGAPIADRERVLERLLPEQNQIPTTKGSHG